MLIDAAQLASISKYRPVIKHHESLITAAVAIILRDGPFGTEFLMMQRTQHKNDPWSGQMSFPGGKLDASDRDHKAAAIREAFEEVGVSLSERDYIGRIDDVYGLKANGVFSVHVACFVFKPVNGINLCANEEVADMVWVPFSHLQCRSNAVDYFHPHDTSLKMPAVLLNESKTQILWGLSLRMVLNFFGVINEPMSVLNQSENEQMHDIDRLVPNKA